MKKTTEHCFYDSSMIVSSTYTFDTKRLIVEFNGGSNYEFNEVDLEDYQAFSTTSDSIGKAFNMHIKKYEGKKLEFQK